MTIPDRALTLYQPWAWLVAAGHKPIENRPPGFSFKSFRGDFWIHAGRESKESIASGWDAYDLCAEILGKEFRLPHARELAFGCIIGRATITGIVPPRLSLLGKPDPAPIVPWHFPNQYGFRVERARLLEKPVPCRGYQGFWRVPADAMAKLSETA
jgi:ASCH domain